MAQRLGDTSLTDLLNNTASIQQNSQTVLPTTTPEQGRGIGNAIKRSAAGGFTGLGRFAQEVGLPGSEGLTNYGEELSREAGPAPVTKLEDIPKDLSGTFQEGIGAGVGSMVPSMTAGLAGNVVGGAIGGIAGSVIPGAGTVAGAEVGRRIGGALGRAAINIPTYIGSNLQRQDETGNHDFGKAVAGALGQAATEELETQAIGGILPAGFAKKIGLDAVSKVMGHEGFTGGTITRAVKGAMAAGASNAAEEYIQQQIERAQAGLDIGSPEAIKEGAFNAALGMVAGGSLGSVAGAANAKPVVNIPGLNQEFTNKDIKNTYERINELYAQKKDLESKGQDIGDLDANIEELANHLQNNYISPTVEEGKTSTVKPVEKQEAEAVHNYLNSLKASEKGSEESTDIELKQLSPLQEYSNENMAVALANAKSRLKEINDKATGKGAPEIIHPETGKKIKLTGKFAQYLSQDEKDERDQLKRIISSGNREALVGWHENVYKPRELLNRERVPTEGIQVQELNQIPSTGEEITIPDISGERYIHQYGDAMLHNEDKVGDFTKDFGQYIVEPESDTIDIQGISGDNTPSNYTVEEVNPDVYATETKTFKGKGAATRAVNKFGLKETHEIVEVAPKEFKVVPKRKQEDAIENQEASPIYGSGSAQQKLRQESGNLSEDSQGIQSSGQEETETGGLKLEGDEGEYTVFNAKPAYEVGEITDPAMVQAIMAKHFGGPKIDFNQKGKQTINLGDFSPKEATTTFSNKIAKIGQAVNKLAASLKDAGVKIIYVDSIADIKEDKPRQIAERHSTGSIIAGMFHKPSNTVYVIGQGNRSPQEAIGTVFHELVGHYGMRKILGKKWDNYMERLLDTTDISKKIYALGGQWHMYLTQYPATKNDRYVWKNVRDSSGQPVVTSKTAAVKLADEYTAELARLFTNESYRDKFGLKTAENKSFLDKVVGFIKHILRTIGFGTVSEKITDNDIMKLLGESYSSIFEGQTNKYKVNTKEELTNNPAVEFSLPEVNIGNAQQYIQGVELSNKLTLKLFQNIAANQTAKNKKQFIRNKLKEINASKSEIEVVEQVLETYPSDSSFTWTQLVQDVEHVLMPLTNETTKKYANTYLNNIDLEAKTSEQREHLISKIQLTERKLAHLDYIGRELLANKKISEMTFKSLLDSYYNTPEFNLASLDDIIDEQYDRAIQYGDPVPERGIPLYKELYNNSVKVAKSERRRYQQMLEKLPKDELEGNVTRIYKGNFDTQPFMGGANHFPDIKEYVGHVREFVRGEVLHLFEVQSDLEQGQITKTVDNSDYIDYIKEKLDGFISRFRSKYDSMVANGEEIPYFLKKKYILDNLDRYLEGRLTLNEAGEKLEAFDEKYNTDFIADLSRLQLPNDMPTLQDTKEIPKEWQQLSKHIGKRMIRERLKQAAQEGISRVRVATADTAARTEGWVDNTVSGEPFVVRELANKSVFINNIVWHDGKASVEEIPAKTTGQVKIGDTMDQSQVLWEVTKKDGTSEYVKVARLTDENGSLDRELTIAHHYIPFMPSTQGKTNVKVQPKYKGLYNKYKDIYQKMLEKEYNAKTVTDDKGNTWHEVELSSTVGDDPVVAFAVQQGQQQSLFNLEEQGFGRTNFDEKTASWNRFNNWLAHKPVAKNFVHLGTLQYQNQLLRLYNKGRGQTTEVERLTRQVHEKMGNLNKVQKIKLYEMLTTQNYDRSRLVGILSDDVLDLAQKAKDKISEYGQTLVDLGKLDPITYETNKDQYLRTRYAKYLGESKGAGKIGSYQNYLRKKGDMPESVKAGLLEIKDPEFLLADTLGTIGRDVALLGILRNIRFLSDKENLGWVIDDPSLLAADGTEMTLEEAKEHLKRQESVIADKGELLGYDHPDVILLQQEATTLSSQIANSYKELDTKIQAFAQQQGLPSMSAKEYADTYYSRLPKGKQYGKLSGMYVRKEIYDDLREGIDAFYNMNTQGKILKTMETMHRFWKTAKVSWNLPTWFQNAFGNFGLLDLASPTNMGSLAQMTAQEIHSAISKKPSKYWTLGQENGVFGTTLAATELYTNEAEMVLKLKKLGDINSGNKFADAWDHMKNIFLTVNEHTSNWYGLLEGTFKVVALRDHIQRWEKETGQKFDNLQGNEREALIASAVRFSQDALFDYSAVPNWVKQIRRFPLGSPFITFSYKALPAIMKALRYNPKKFIKYAIMPTLMMQMFLMANPDMDEEDYEEILAKQPSYMKDKSSMYLLPTKNADGKWEFWDAGYLLPWAPFVNWGLYVKNHFDAMNYETTAESTVDAAYKLLSETFGVLGGPAPQIISVWKTGVDPFTKEPIFNEGQPASEKWWKAMSFTANQMMPSWLTGQGFAGKLQDALDASVGPFEASPLNQYGTNKGTVGEAIAGLGGIKIKAVDPRESHLSNLKMYALEEQKIQKAKMAELKDRNLDPMRRADVIKRYNELLINQRRKRMEYLKSVNSSSSEQ